jgi:hypothetical protein
LHAGRKPASRSFLAEAHGRFNAEMKPFRLRISNGLLDFAPDACSKAALLLLLDAAIVSGVIRHA